MNGECTNIRKESVGMYEESARRNERRMNLGTRE